MWRRAQPWTWQSLVSVQNQASAEFLLGNIEGVAGKKVPKTMRPSQIFLLFFRSSWNVMFFLLERMVMMPGARACPYRSTIDVQDDVKDSCFCYIWGHEFESIWRSSCFFGDCSISTSLNAYSRVLPFHSILVSNRQLAAYIHWYRSRQAHLTKPSYRQFCFIHVSR